MLQITAPQDTRRTRPNCLLTPSPWRHHPLLEGSRTQCLCASARQCRRATSRTAMPVRLPLRCHATVAACTTSACAVAAACCSRNSARASLHHPCTSFLVFPLSTSVCMFFSPLSVTLSALLFLASSGSSFVIVALGGGLVGPCRLKTGGPLAPGRRSRLVESSSPRRCRRWGGGGPPTRASAPNSGGPTV